MLASATLIVALAIVLVTPRAAGYELSIYEAYPPAFWFSVSMSLALATLILVRSAFGKASPSTWGVGLALILLTAGTVALLPLFRGYAAYGRNDQMNHLGAVKEIQTSGRLGSPQGPTENFYPGTHMLATSASYLTGLAPRAVLMVAPFYLFVFYAISVNLLARELAMSYGQRLLVTAFGSLPIFSWLQAAFIPSLSTFFLLPFLLFLYCRAASHEGAKHKLPVALMALSMPVLHPLDGGLFAAFTILCLYLGYRLSHPRSRHLSPGDGSNVPTAPTLRLVGVMLATWFVWSSSFRTFSMVVRVAANLDYVRSPLLQHQSLRERWDVPTSDMIQTLVINLGPVFIYVIPAVAVALVTWVRVFIGRRAAQPGLMGFSLMLGSFGALALVSALGFASAEDPSAPFRYLPYLLLSATFLNGLGLHGLASKPPLTRSVPFLASLALVTSGLLGIFNLHWSPIIKNANQQVTLMDLTGARWFFDHQGNHQLIDQIFFNQMTYARALSGGPFPPRNVRLGLSDREWPPVHFGYDKSSMYGEAYAEDRYFVSDRLSRIWYSQGPPARYGRDLWKWTPEDFEKLESIDASAARIYANGEFEVFYVRAMKALTVRVHAPLDVRR